jgi:hypothetical protein
MRRAMQPTVRPVRLKRSAIHSRPANSRRRADLYQCIAAFLFLRASCLEANPAARLVISRKAERCASPGTRSGRGGRRLPVVVAAHRITNRLTRGARCAPCRRRQYRRLCSERRRTASPLGPLRCSGPRWDWPSSTGNVIRKCRDHNGCNREEDRTAAAHVFLTGPLPQSNRSPAMCSRPQSRAPHVVLSIGLAQRDEQSSRGLL